MQNLTEQLIQGVIEQLIQILIEKLMKGLISTSDTKFNGTSDTNSTREVIQGQYWSVKSSMTKWCKFNKLMDTIVI